MKRFFKTMAFTLLGLVLSVNLMAMDASYEVGSSPLSSVSDGDLVAWGTSSTNLGKSIESNWVYCSDTKAEWIVFKVVAGTDGFYLQNIANDNYVYSSADKKVAFDGTNKTLLTITSSGEHTNIVYGGSNIGYYTLNSTGIRPYKSNLYTDAHLYKVTAGSSKTLVSIAISGNPDKTTYETGESFDVTGLTVTGTYSEGDPEEITTGIEWTITPATFTSTSQTSVSVTAKVGEVTSEAFVVNGLTVKEFVQTYANTYTSDASLSEIVKGYKVKWEGCKEADGYVALKIGKGETASITVPAGTKTVHLHMVAWNGESNAVAVKLGSTALSSITPTADAGVSGSSTTYTIATEPKTENSYYFAIEVNADEGTTLSLTTASNKRAILFGVNFEADTKPSITADAESIEFEQKELSGTVTDSKVISATGKNLTAAISASMKTGSDAIFSVVANGTPTAAAGEFTVSYSTIEAGEYAGTVVLSSGETSLEIPVSASVVAHIPVLQSIAVSGTPTKTEYTVGDAFETAGLVVTGTYDVGEPQTITEGIEWEVTPATFSATTETSVSVVATALEKTSEAFVVNGLTVAAAPQIATYYFSLDPLHLYGKSGVSATGSTAGDIENGYVFTESPTTITFTQNTNKTQTRFWDKSGTVELRIYDGSSFTIASTDYNITKVEFAGTVNLKVGETTVSDKTWTGKQKSVTFVNTNTSSALTGITVTYATAAPSAATPTITPSAEAETYFDAITVTLATTTEGAAIYYTIDDTDPTTASTLYENPIAVSATTTVKAIAVKDGLDNSDVATKKFTFGPVYANLVDLVNAGEPTTTGEIVKVTLTNEEIAAFDGTQGIYIDVPTDPVKRIEVYCKNRPEAWVVGGTVSGTLQCTWKKYSSTWELCPTSWTELTYNVPAGTTEVVLTGTPTKNVYIDGEEFDPAGITVTATINGVPTVVTEGITWSVETLTLGTTSIDITAIYNNVVSNTIENFAVTVNEIQQSTIANFIENEGGRCYLVGEITSAISNGSFTLTDASGSIYVYKHTLNGVASIAQGDYIKVIADEYEYYQSKTHEAKNVVVIEKPEKPQVDVTGISLDKTATTITIGKTETLVATIEPLDASDKEVIWSSSDETVATVVDGVVSAKVAGSAVITAKSHENEEITATCTVTVVAAQVKYFALATSTDDLDAAVTNGKKVVIAPATSETDEVVMGTYASGNNIKAIEADYADERIALEVGEDAFYTIAKDGDYYTFQDGNGKYIYAAGGTGSNNHLKAKTELEATGKWTIAIDATTKNATIKTSDATVARHTIMFNSTLFSCYASGQTAIALYVEAEKPAYVPVESIELNETSAEVMVGKKLTLTATVGPDNATQKGVTWTSNNDKVTVVDGLVTVDAEATVGATATITATTVGTTTDGGSEHLSATCIITVTELVGTKYGLVSNINTLYDGAVVVLGAVYEKNSEMKYAVSGAIGIGKYMASVDVAAADYADEVMLSSGATEITLHKVEGGWTMTSEEGNIYMSGSDIKVGTSQDATVWTISIENGVAKIASGDNVIKYNISAPRFKTYGSGQTSIGIYMKNLVAVRTGLTVGKIGTICYPKAIAAVDGANLYQPNYKDDAVKNIYFSTPDEYSAGLPMIFQADREIMKVLFTGEAVTDPIAKENARGMVGNLTDEEQTIDPGMYIFTQNKLWITGEGCIVDPNRAYVDLNYVPFSDGQLSHDMPSGAPRRTICLGNGSASTPTGVNNLREGDAVNTAQKFFINGNIVIKNQGQLYNAQGNKLK